jgi:hypothetical protein
MNLIQLQYALQRASAHVAAPVMRATGLRFSKKSRDSRFINALICRVSANLLADREQPTPLRDMWAIESRCRDEVEHFAGPMTDEELAQYARWTTTRPLLSLAAVALIIVVLEGALRLLGF